PSGSVGRNAAQSPRKRTTRASGSQRPAIPAARPAIRDRCTDGASARQVAPGPCVAGRITPEPAAMTRTALALAALLLGACAPRTPRVVAGPLVDGLDAFLAAHPVGDGQAVRVDEVARTATASHHLVQIHGSETPHRHVAHELTAVLLRGRGTLTL